MKKIKNTIIPRFGSKYVLSLKNKIFIDRKKELKKGKSKYKKIYSIEE